MITTLLSRTETTAQRYSMVQQPRCSERYRNCLTIIRIYTQRSTWYSSVSNTVLTDSNLKKSSIFPIKIRIPTYRCQTKAFGSANAKTTIKGLHKAAFLQIIREFEKIFKLFKNVTKYYSLLDDIINYGLSYGACKLAKDVKTNSTEGRDVEPESSQPAYVVQPTFYRLKVSSQSANKKLQASQPVPAS